MTALNPAVGMYGLYPNIYNNQVALNDLTNLDMYSPIGAVNPMMSMTGSIFGGYPMSGYMPYMPSFGGNNYEEYYKNYEKYQDFMIDSQVRRQQKMRNADLRLNSPQEGIVKQASYLHDKIMRNEQLQIEEAYQNFKNSVKSMYGNASDEEIANRASTMYKQITGVSITDDIRRYGRDSFTQGFLQTITFGLADGKTAEENISSLTKQPVGRSEEGKKFAGNAAAGAMLGAGLALGCKGIKLNKVPLLKVLSKIRVLVPLGAITAGIIGLNSNK